MGSVEEDNSSSKSKAFDQEGSIIDPIDMEPLSLAPLATLVPYGTSKDEILATEGFGEKEGPLRASKCQKFEP